MTEESRFWQWAWSILVIPIGWVIARQEEHRKQVNDNTVAIASMKKDVSHIKEKGDDTHKDVKELLKRQS